MFAGLQWGELMERLPYKHHHEAIDAISRHNVPPNRKFIIGWVKYGLGGKPECSASGGNTRYGDDIMHILRIYHRRPHIVSVVVYQRLDVVEANGVSSLPPATAGYTERYRRHWPKVKA